MRIAIISNFWYLRGGLERVMLADAAGLEARGHTVLPFASAHPMNEPTPYMRYFPDTVDHASLGKDHGLRERARIAYRLVHNMGAVSAFDQFLREQRPDIVHQHGTSRQLSPSVLAHARNHGIPTVMKVADHIMRCPKAVLSRPGASVCEEVSCAGHRYDRAIRFKCVHGSRAASTIAAIELAFNRGLRRYERSVTIFLVASNYLRERLLEDGFPPNRVIVEPNPVEPFDNVGTTLGADFVAYGRMVDYKGFDVLIDAAIDLPNVKFVLGGDGPHRRRLEERSVGLRNVEFVGHVSGDALDALLRRARAVVFPSLAPEGFGNITLEAWRACRPVIVSDRGALPEVVTHEVNGLLFNPDQPGSLQSAVRTLDRDVGLAVRLAAAGRELALTTYSMESHLDRLEALYARLLSLRNEADGGTS